MISYIYCHVKWKRYKGKKNLEYQNIQFCQEKKINSKFKYSIQNPKSGQTKRLWCFQQVDSLLIKSFFSLHTILSISYLMLCFLSPTCSSTCTNRRCNNRHSHSNHNKHATFFFLSLLTYFFNASIWFHLFLFPLVTHKLN